MKFSIKDFFSKCDQIRRFLRISLHLLKKSVMGNFFFCAVIFRNALITEGDFFKCLEWLITFVRTEMMQHVKTRALQNDFHDRITLSDIISGKLYTT